MLVAALGCNLAWEIIDAGVYLLARLHDQGSKIEMLRALRDASDPASARQLLSDALPPLVASIITPDQIKFIGDKLRQSPKPSARPQLTKKDVLGATAICALSFLSTFPIVIPFMVMADARLALRTSNVIAIAMFFLCGYALGIHSDLRPWLMGLLMVALGTAMVGVAIALGG